MELVSPHFFGFVRGGANAVEQISGEGRTPKMTMAHAIG